jgi:hypothetical protein
MDCPQEWLWLSVDDGELTKDEESFLAALRAIALGWAVAPGSMAVVCAEDNPSGVLIVYADIVDEDRNVGLMTVGVHVDAGPRARADRLHNQSFQLPEVPIGDAAEFEGSSSDLAAEVGKWFESMFRRRFVRREWVEGDRVLSAEWLEEDSGRSVVRSGKRPTDPSASIREHRFAMIPRGSA